MPTVTTKGKKLADTLEPLIGSSEEIDEICSKLCRLAATHHRYAEMECNNPSWGQEDYDQFDRLDAQIEDLIKQLPETEEGPLTPYLGRDPRGVTVKLRINDMERHPAYNGWALEAILVP